MLLKTHKICDLGYRKVRHGPAVSCLFLVFCLLLLGPAWSETPVRVPESRSDITYSLAPVAQHVMPSVVNVYARRFVAQRRRSLFDDPFFRQFFGEQFGGQRAPERRRSQESLGSGVIVAQEGLIVTNHHVIEDAEDLTVILWDRREYKADIILQDERTDLAVLRLVEAPADLVAIEIRDSDEVQVGDLVLAVGNPFGVGQTVTSGIISALARTQVGVSDYQSFIQTDAAINPGNSGGALVGIDGRLVGVNTAIFSRSGGSVGIGFAIPANMVAQVIRAAQNGSEVIRPWLGAMFQLVSNDLAQTFGLDRPRGAAVTFLHEQSPLRAATIRVGDVIIAVDGQDVGTPEELRYRIGTRDIDGQVRLDFIRNGKKLSGLTPLVAPPSQPAANEQLLQGVAILSGLRIANVNPVNADQLRLPLDRKGVIVLAVERNSQAARFGFRTGDIIKRMGDQSVEKVSDILKLKDKIARNIVIEIQRGDRILRANVR